MADGSRDSFGDALAALAAWLDAAGVPYAIIGGVAVSLQATARYTEDIDAVIWTSDRAWEALLVSGPAFAIHARIEAPLEFAARTRMLLLRHESGVPIDVSCGALPFEQDLVESAATLSVGAFSVRVARPEHLLVTKAIANRPRDRADIESLLRVHPDLDVRQARLVIVEFANAIEQPELVAEFDRLTGRPADQR